MSTAWDLGCRTCDVKSGVFDENHGDVQIREVIALREEIARIPEHLPDVVTRHGIDYNALLGLGRFLRAHAGHDLRAKDEYGRWDGECAARVSCTSCGHDWYCRLPEKHAGDHAQRERK